jgi:hypothetical protein
MSVIDCPSCEAGGYDEEGPRACCGVYTLSCGSHEDPVEWVEATGVVVSSGKGEVCVCERSSV